MLLSIGLDNKVFKARAVQGFNELTTLICKSTYSPSLFKDDQRNNSNFIYSEIVALDFDGGLKIEEAVEMFSDYKNIVAPTRSHRVLKNGLTSDRFRVILFLSHPVTDPQQYRVTVKRLLEAYPQADKQCSDPARMYYPSTQVYSTNPNGKLVDPVELHTSPYTSNAKEGVDFSKKPHGWSNCCWAISNGMFEKGEGNSAMMSLASNLRKLNYSKSQAYQICKDALQQRKEEYDKVELWSKVIEVIYGEAWQGGVYLCSNEGTWLHDFCSKLGENACKGAERSIFKFTKIDELFSQMPKVNWLVDGLFTVGGMSLISGAPKSGKSTIIRQLAKSVCRGEQFLGRDVSKGRVLYLALEEQPELLYEQFKKIGLSGDDDIKIHIGGVFGEKIMEEFSDFVLLDRPDLIIIDTMMLFSNISDVNNYNEMNEALTSLRELARKSGAHVTLIHHSNKSEHGGTNSILGSVATHGAVDCAVIFRKEGKKRIITTSQRGGRPFDDQELHFDENADRYTLGAERSEW